MLDPGVSAPLGFGGPSVAYVRLKAVYGHRCAIVSIAYLNWSIDVAAHHCPLPLLFPLQRVLVLGLFPGLWPLGAPSLEIAFGIWVLTRFKGWAARNADLANIVGRR